MNSLRSQSAIKPRLSISSRVSDAPKPPRTDSWDDDYEKRSTFDDVGPVPEIGIQRTFSEKLRYHMLGWQADTYNLGTTEIYTYHPDLETIVATCALLESLNVPRGKRIFWLCWMWYPFTYIFYRLRLLFIIATHGFRPRVLVAILSHINAMHYAQVVTPPEALRRAVLHPLYKTISPEDISLASRILFVVKPRPPLTGWAKLGWAYGLFATCSLLVIGTELTIQWNYIQGVQNLRTVGQLIPAAIGIGGLARVIYSAIFEPNAMEELCLGRCKLKPRKIAWKEAGVAYERAVKALERSRDLKGKHKEAQA